MQFKLLVLAASIGLAIAAPVVELEARKGEGIAVINSRFAKYEAEKRDADPKNAVINSRFAKYEAEKRDPEADGKNAVINSRFAKYEAEKRDAEAEKAAVINSRFAKYEAE